MATDDLRDRIADLSEQVWTEVASVLAAKDVEIERLNLEIQGYQVGEGYERGHEHGVNASARVIEKCFAEINLLRWLHAEAVWQRDEAWEELDEHNELALKYTAENAELRAYSDTARHHQQQHAEAYRELVKVRAELDAVKATAVVLPDDWTAQIHDAIVVHGVSMESLIESWRSLPDTEATEQARPGLPSEEWCDRCESSVSGTHWHCAQCGQVSGMMGHLGNCPKPADNPATPSEPRAVYREPGDVQYEHDEDDNPVDPSVGWDIAFGCRVTFGIVDGTWRVDVAVSDGEKRDGGSIRSVTRQQIRAFAYQLIKLTEVVEDQAGGRQP